MEVQKEFEFLPAWLFDDAMTTLSNAGSTIGAHIDNYNVFIIQLEGTRKWELQTNPDKEYHEGLEVKILKNFTPDTTYTLEPGDLIFIPPHVAHRGTSITDGLSLSIGFKSIEDKAIMEQVAVELVNQFQSELFYKTSYASAVTDPFEVSEKTMNEIKARILTNMNSEQYLEDAILKFMSTTKRPVQETEIQLEEFLELAQAEPLFKDEYVRVSAFKTRGQYRVSINDFTLKLNTKDYEFIKYLAYKTCEDEIDLNEYSEYKNLAYTLYLKGVLFFNQEEQSCE